MRYSRASSLAQIHKLCDDKSVKREKGFSLIFVIALVFLVVLVLLIFYSLKAKKEDKNIPTPISTTNQNKAKTVKSSAAPTDTEQQGYQNDISVNSPDGQQFARFYYKGPTQYEGGTMLNKVDIVDKKTDKVRIVDLSGPITASKGPIKWAVNGKIYFTHSTNGIGIYALWSSNIDGTESKLISGKSDLDDQKKNLTNEAIYGASSFDVSPDGKLIITLRSDLASPKKPFWVMNADGTNSRPITLQTQLTNISDIEWEDDNYTFTFTASDGEETSEYESDLSGATPEAVED